LVAYLFFSFPLIGLLAWWYNLVPPPAQGVLSLLRIQTRTLLFSPKLSMEIGFSFSFHFHLPFHVQSVLAVATSSCPSFAGCPLTHHALLSAPPFTRFEFWCSPQKNNYLLCFPRARTPCFFPALSPPPGFLSPFLMSATV